MARYVSISKKFFLQHVKSSMQCNNEKISLTISLRLSVMKLVLKTALKRFM